VLTTDTEAPVVTETTVSADLLEALEVLTELGVDTVGEDLSVLAVDNVALPVKEPGRDLVCGVLG
jgi:5-enolpyruvylshikimate-3-phosphate synthase